MKIQIVADGRVYRGTPLQIVEAMKYRAFGFESSSLAEYIEATLARLDGDWSLEGDWGEPELASWFVEGLVREGLAQRVSESG